MEPLTKDHFEQWREKEFVPHVESGNVYQKKVDGLEVQIGMWLKVLSVSVTLGGLVVAIFLWVLLEKNTQLKDVQQAIVAISGEHKQIVTTLEAIQRESMRQAEVDRVVMTALLDFLKEQQRIHRDSK